VWRRARARTVAAPTRPAKALPSRPRRSAGPAHGVGHARPSTAAEATTPGQRRSSATTGDGGPGRADRQVFRFARLSRVPRLALGGRPRGPGAGVAGGSGNLANLASLGPSPNRTNAIGGFPDFQVPTSIDSLDPPAVVAESRPQGDHRAAVEHGWPKRAQWCTCIATEPFPNCAPNGARGVRNSSPTSAKPQPRSERQHNEAGQVGK